MWHSAAYSASLAASAVAAAVAAVNESVFRTGAANGFVLQEDMMLIAASAQGFNLDHPQLKSPKLNQFSPLFIFPALILSAAGGNTDGLIRAQWPYRPFTFRNQEEVTAFADNTNSTTAEQQSIICDFSNGIDTIPAGEELTIKATSTTAAVAFSWTTLTYTLSQTLPEGLYAMIASEHFSASAIYHRWTFWGQFYRPGFPSSTARSSHQALEVTTLQKGLAGQFSNVTLPNCEVFCETTDNSHEIYMRVIKVA